MFDGQIVCLGSGITCETEDPVETILENRRLHPEAAQLLTVEGSAAVPCAQYMGQELVCRGYVHLDGGAGPASSIGYVVHGNSELHLLAEHRTGTWGGVTEGRHAGRVCENDHLVLWLSHGTKPRDAAYAYTLLPGADAAGTAAYAARPAVTVLENSTAAHAVCHEALGITGVNFWQAGECAGFGCDGEACLMAWRRADTLTLAVADPTGSDVVLTLRTPYAAAEIVACDSAVTVESMAPLTVRADTDKQEGKSLTLTVRLAGQ